MENEAFQLIELLYIDNEKDSPQEKIGSSAIDDAIDITDYVVGDSLISWIHDNNDEHADILFEKHDYRIRFGNINYRKYKDFINRLLNTEEFNGKVTFKFLELEVFRWLISIKENAKVDISLFSFISNRVEQEKIDEVFYFPIINLDIEKIFKIGYVEFTYFTKEYWDIMFTQSNFEKDFFNSVFRNNYQGKVLASIPICGIADKAEELAKKQVELAVDVLKLFGPTIAFPKRVANFDLDYRLNYLVSTEYLTRHLDEEYKFSIVQNGNYYPVKFTTKTIDGFQNDNNKISKFILSEKNVELDKIIRQSINMLANCLTISDLHLRIANMFTLLESICLEEERDNKITSKTLARIPKLLTQNFEEKEFAKLLINEFYEIRHKFVHKAIRLPINFDNLGYFQEMIKLLIFRLIDNRHLLNKVNLIKILDEIKA